MDTFFENEQKREQQKQLKDARAKKPDRSDSFYLEEKFATGEYKDEFYNSKNIIRKNLARIYKIEEEEEKNKKAHALLIGEHVDHLIEIIRYYNKTYPNHEKLSSTRYLELQFEQDIRRLHDYRAAYLASKKSNDSNLSLTSLIFLGQSLNSKDLSRKELATSVLNDGYFPNEAKISLSEIKAKDLSNFFKQQLNHEETIYELMENVYRNLSSAEAELEKLSKSDMPTSCNEKESKDKILSALDKIHSKKTDIENLFIKIQGTFLKAAFIPDPVSPKRKM